MTIQVNSDKTVTVSAKLSRFVKSEAARILERFAPRLTRVEVHLSDVDNLRNGQADKRCVVEARPAGTPPVTVTASAQTVEASVAAALGKMKRALTTDFGRRKATTAALPPKSPAKAASKKAVPAKRASTKKKTAAKKTTAKQTATGRRKKKRIYQARRKPWPAR